MNIAAEIKKLCEQISREFRPERVILFGSHAYGSPSRRVRRTIRQSFGLPV